MKFTNVFVKNLPDSINEDKLRELCEAHGEVLCCTYSSLFHNLIFNLCARMVVVRTELRLCDPTHSRQSLHVCPGR